jgi:hypothetical protein
MQIFVKFVMILKNHYYKNIFLIAYSSKKYLEWQA